MFFNVTGACKFFVCIPTASENFQQCMTKQVMEQIKKLLHGFTSPPLILISCSAFFFPSLPPDTAINTQPLRPVAALYYALLKPAGAYFVALALLQVARGFYLSSPQCKTALESQPNSPQVLPSTKHILPSQLLALNPCLSVPP